MKSVPEQLRPAESVDILVAGSDTTAYTLATGLFHILRRPELKERLVREVREALPSGDDLPSFTQLEKIEYLVRLLSSDISGTFLLIIGCSGPA